ncbi:MAG: molybdopterin-dependent oxidoreductase [Planctomycetaceae bacterium]
MSEPCLSEEHHDVTRRCFLQAGLAGAAAGAMIFPAETGHAEDSAKPVKKPAKAGAFGDPWLTPAEEFRDVSRGKPIPHTLSEDRKRNVGLTRDTWRLEVISDPDQPATLEKPLTIANGTALTFDQLLELAARRSVRFAKVMTCLNLGCPLGMGLWEGVPLRDVVWLTQPKENLRRVFYSGYHNDDPDQIFRSSLPVGRVLEDPFDLPPVILCYRLNGEWLNSERGGPVRMVVPEAYGFKSVKWLNQVVLSNLPHANDTYAEKNNDIDSPLKTFAATLTVPENVKSGQPITVSGYAQVGISGLSRVQVFMEPVDSEHQPDDPWWIQAPWQDAELLPAPQSWQALPGGIIPPDTFGFDAAGRPTSWPLRLTKAHWTVVLPGLRAGDYHFRCRSIDAKGQAQPLPRPFRKSGHAAIETVRISVVD